MTGNKYKTYCIINDICDVTGKSRRTIYRYIEKGKITGIKKGKFWLFDFDQVTYLDLCANIDISFMKYMDLVQNNKLLEILHKVSKICIEIKARNRH